MVQGRQWIILLLLETCSWSPERLNTEPSSCQPCSLPPNSFLLCHTCGCILLLFPDRQRWWSEAIRYLGNKQQSVALASQFQVAKVSAITRAGSHWQQSSKAINSLCLSLFLNSNVKTAEQHESVPRHLTLAARCCSDEDYILKTSKLPRNIAVLFHSNLIFKKRFPIYSRSCQSNYFWDAVYICECILKEKRCIFPLWALNGWDSIITNGGDTHSPPPFSCLTGSSLCTEAENDPSPSPSQKTDGTCTKIHFPFGTETSFSRAMTQFLNNSFKLVETCNWCQFQLMPGKKEKGEACHIQTRPMVWQAFC